MIARIDHIQLAMPAGEEDRARACFGELLGMREQEKPPLLAGRGGCWFTAGSAILHVGVEPDFRPQRKAHPAFCVTDVDQLAERFAQAGLKVEWDEAVPGRKRFYTADPFGNRLEFIRSGDGFSER
jgi:catechol 2,3-dioxygenase-like lactoylglutathione lyase family enzyme